MDTQPNSSNPDPKSPDEFAGAPSQSSDSSDVESTDQASQEQSYNLGNHGLVIQPIESIEPETSELPAEGSTPSGETTVDSEETETEFEPEAETEAPATPSDALAEASVAESEPWSVPVTVADTAQAGALATGAAMSIDAKIAEANGTTAATDASTPQAVFPAGSVAPAPQKKSWWNKKHSIMVAVIALIVVALGGGSAAAYTLWYQAPSKVLSDATINFISAKSMTYTGSLSAGSSGMSLALSMNGSSSGQTASVNLDAKLSGGSTKFDIPISLVGNAQTFYFKLSNLGALESQFVDPYLTEMSATSAKTQIDAFVKQIDGTWYTVSPDDLNESSQDKKIGQCVQNVIDDIRTDKSTQNALLKVYQAHPLFTVTKNLGSQSGSLGYEVKPVSDADAKAFVKAFKTTPTYKSLIKCDSSYASAFDTSSLTSTSTTNSPAIDVWVSRWSHQLTKITMSDNSDGNDMSFNFEPKVGASASITMPKNAKSIKELQSQIESLSESLGMSSASNTEAQMNATSIDKSAEMYNAIVGTYPTLAQLQNPGADASEAKLDPSIASNVITTTPTSANPDKIQYKRCSANGGEVVYYDTSAAKATVITFGAGC